MILRVDRRVKAIVVAIDLYDYKYMEDFPVYDNPLFESLGRYGKTLEQEMLEQCSCRKEVVYAVYGIIDHTIANQGISLVFWVRTIQFYGYLGFKYLYSRISHPASLYICLKLGGWVVSMIDLGKENPELK